MPALLPIKILELETASGGLKSPILCVFAPWLFLKNKKFGQQTPRRWGWGTPLKKRAATRMLKCDNNATICQLVIVRFYYIFGLP